MVECASFSLQAVFTQTSGSIRHESVSGFHVTHGVFPFEKKEVHVSGVKVFYGYRLVQQRVTGTTVCLPGCPAEGSEWFCTGLEETSKMFALAKHTWRLGDTGSIWSGQFCSCLPLPGVDRHWWKALGSPCQLQGRCLWCMLTTHRGIDVAAECGRPNSSSNWPFAKPWSGNWIKANGDIISKDENNWGRILMWRMDCNRELFREENGLKTVVRESLVPRTTSPHWDVGSWALSDRTDHVKKEKVCWRLQSCELPSLIIYF